MRKYRYCIDLTLHTTKSVLYTKTSFSMLFRETVAVIVWHATCEYIVMVKILSFLRLKYVAHLITSVAFKVIRPHYGPGVDSASNRIE